MGLFDILVTENKIRKLNKYKSDLADDYDAIQTYNMRINSVISDFQSFVRSGNSAVTDKLEEFKESYQGSDSNLSSARSYIQREINRLENSVTAGGGNGGGGGGR